MLMAPFDYQLQTSPDIAIRLAGGGKGRSTVSVYRENQSMCQNSQHLSLHCLHISLSKKTFRKQHLERLNYYILGQSFLRKEILRTTVV